MAETLIAAHKVSKELLSKARVIQAYAVLRVALLWTDGLWQFDDRVRLSEDVRVRIDTGRLLLECARHLPLPVVQARLRSGGDLFSFVSRDATDTANLLPCEAAILSRAANFGNAIRLTELIGNAGQSEDELRAVYALSLAGWLERVGAKTLFTPVAAVASDPAQAVSTTQAVLKPRRQGVLIEFRHGLGDAVKVAKPKRKSKPAV